MSIQSEITKALETLNPLVEGFLSIGFSLEDVQSYQSSHQPISPSVLSFFPPGLKYPESIPMFAFPWGLKIQRSAQETLGESFNFSVLNNQGQELFCAALMIHQSVGSLKPQTLFRTVTREKIDPSLYLTNSPEIDLLESQGHSEGNRRSRSAYKKNRSRKTKEIYTNDEIKQLCPGQAIVPKCLVLMSKYPFFEVLKKILMGIFHLMRRKIDLPFECYLNHLFLNVPLPPKGSIEVVYQIMDQMILIKVPPPNMLPLFDCNLTYLFKSLQVSVILKVFGHVLMEESVVFLSNCNDKLTAVIYSVLSLLYPFKWSFLTVPILPFQLIDFLYSPVKFLFGISSKFKEEVILRCSAEILIIDLDEGSVITHDEIIQIKQKFDPEPVWLPEHYSKKLAKRITDLTEKLRNNETNRLDSSTTELLRFCFFQFFVSVFKDYQGSLIGGASDFTKVKNFFNVEEFLHKQRNDKEFFRSFFKTRMFAYFCAKNLKPENIEQQMENLLFNDHILLKKNRSGFSIHKKQPTFIYDKSHNWRGKFVVPLPENCFGMKSSNFYYTFPEIDYEVMQKFGLPKNFINRVPAEFSFPTAEKPKVDNLEQIKDFGIFGIWIKLWTSCLWAQEEVEKMERVEELASVLEIISKNNEKLTTQDFLFVVKKSLEVDPDIALHIFALMQRNNVHFTQNARRWLLKVTEKIFNRSVSVKVDISDCSKVLELNSEVLGFFNQKVRKRVFNKKGVKVSNPQRVNIHLVQKCMICGKVAIIQDETLKNFCCKLLMRNMLLVSVGEGNNCREMVICSSVQSLSEHLESFLKEQQGMAKLEDLRADSELFWNLVWHFNKNSLNIKFFVPYERLDDDEEFKIRVFSDDYLKIDLTPGLAGNKSVQTETFSAFLFETN
jgi:hypothetical protein